MGHNFVFKAGMQRISQARNQADVKLTTLFAVKGIFIINDFNYGKLRVPSSSSVTFTLCSLK